MAPATAPVLLRVDITPYAENHPDLHGYVQVTPIWGGVDRPDSFSWATKPAIAVRLRRAIMAGVVLLNPHVKTDITGKTYVEYDNRVSGKYANADLKRLGY
jgi:hypothetical protein